VRLTPWGARHFCQTWHDLTVTSAHLGSHCSPGQGSGGGVAYSTTSADHLLKLAAPELVLDAPLPASRVRRRAGACPPHRRTGGRPDADGLPGVAPHGRGHPFRRPVVGVSASISQPWLTQEDRCQCEHMQLVRFASRPGTVHGRRHAPRRPRRCPRASTVPVHRHVRSARPSHSRSGGRRPRLRPTGRPPACDRFVMPGPVSRLVPARPDPRGPRRPPTRRPSAADRGAAGHAPPTGANRNGAVIHQPRTVACPRGRTARGPTRCWMPWSAGSTR
jgi:hypothetical protein